MAVKPEPKEREFEFVTPAQFPTTRGPLLPELAQIWRAVKEIKGYSVGEGVRMKLNGIPAKRLQSVAAVTAQRMGFQVRTKVHEGWLYIQKKTTKYKKGNL